VPTQKATNDVDLVLTFFTDTWLDAVERELCFTIDRSIVEAIENPLVSRLLVANPYRSAPISALRRIQGRPSPPLPSRHKPAEVFQPLRLRRRDPTDERRLTDTYLSYDRALERAASSLGMHEPVVVSANPFAVAYCPFEWAGEVTYYGYDDWSALPALKPWWPAIELAYAAIASRRRRVAAVSQSIVDRIAPCGPAAVVPNGIEPTEWEPPWELPAFTSDMTSPMVLYVGSIGDRLDLTALEATAERIPDAQLVLVGPVGNDQVVSALAGIPNVRIEERVGRKHVAGLIHAADVCIMPHLESELTVSMSPLKLYEYVAGGSPVVATDLPPVRGIDDRVARVRPGDAVGFADAVERALSMPAASEAVRREFISANSWRSRFDELLAFATGSEPSSTTRRSDAK
jgi:glycosyltransferase involved in cell wall biosynthesis